MLVIDTHAHLFSIDEQKYPPREDPSRPPEGLGTLQHLRKEMQRAGVEHACAVQVSGFYGFDNSYILDASKENPELFAGIVTLDPDDPSSPPRLAAFAKEYGIKGLRSVPARNRRLDTPNIRQLWKFAYEHSLPVNVLAGHELASDIDALAAEFPELPIVLDHSLQLVAGGNVDETLTALRRLARRRNVHAKVSFIGNGPHGCGKGFPCEEFQPVVMEVIDLFSPQRCCWGSHFPLEKYAPRLTYTQHLEIYTKELPLSDNAREWIVGRTAQQLWF